MKALVNIMDVKKSFKLGKSEVPVLYGISMCINQGEVVALCGSSGSGKSTLLNLVGGLIKPSSGSITCDGESISNMNENQLALFRRKKMGFIFQSYNVLPDLTALENVELPLIFNMISKSERRKRASEILDIVGLCDRKDHKPSELSGGQQQRVSIARALVNSPKIVLADEPTGNLDSKTEKEIIDLILKMNREQGITFVIVTHDMSVAKRADRVVHLADGLICSEE